MKSSKLQRQRCFDTELGRLQNNGRDFQMLFFLYENYNEAKATQKRGSSRQRGESIWKKISRKSKSFRKELSDNKQEDANKQNTRREERICTGQTILLAAC